MNFQMPKVTKINKFILIAYVSLFVLSAILQKSSGISLSNTFGLWAPKFATGHIYQIVTYPFLGSGIFEVLISGYVLWVFGSILESQWGFKRYLGFLATTVIAGGVIFTLAALFTNSLSPMVGLYGICGSLAMAYAILNPEATMFILVFPVKAKYYAMIIIGVLLYNGFFSGGMAQAWGQLGAYAASYAWMVGISKGIFSKKIKAATSRKVPKNSHLKIVKDEPKNEKNEDDVTYH